MDTPLDGDRPPPTPSPWTYNVVCGLVATALYGIGPGLYQFTVLPSFILLVGGSNFDVGFAEGLQGVSNMVSALPAGYLADKLSRKACIRLGCCLQVLGGAFLLSSALMAESGSTHAFVLLCLSLCIQGVCDGIMNGPMVALMDDSCPAGRRSDVETANMVIYSAASSVGPLLGLVVFLTQGNHWSINSMKSVIVIGVVLGQLANLPAWRMDDKKALGEQSEAVFLQSGLTTASEDHNSEARELVARSSRSTCCGLVKARNVRGWFFFGDVVMSLGAGMTVKFFPVFFNIECHEDPATVQIVFASLAGICAVGTIVVNWIAKRVGRMQVVIPCFMVGITCTMLLGALRSYYKYPGVMVPLFITRCSIMWSCAAIKGSVVADYTPKSQRGRWKALESITAMGWSGSAAVGGWLIDHFGYGDTFVITACFQATVIPVWCMLLPLVAKESELLAAGEAATPCTASPGASTVSMQQVPEK
eukprot:TRINITY_DN16789_c0_g2_i1.p1 TRINITY_DN16789_c0_g2~~TRINITY_DN16789_c0_g2_i1.p1  ORF type:complete len:497 (-),score=32.95 TRINITY_DN16789_c0_g2_i1:137-1564(-)